MTANEIYCVVKRDSGPTEIRTLAELIEDGKGRMNKTMTPKPIYLLAVGTNYHKMLAKLSELRKSWKAARGSVEVDEQKRGGE